MCRSTFIVLLLYQCLYHLRALSSDCDMDIHVTITIIGYHYWANVLHECAHVRRLYIFTGGMIFRKQKQKHMLKTEVSI